jgi:alpha-mannosidase
VPFGHVRVGGQAGSPDGAGTRSPDLRQCDGWIALDADGWGVVVAGDRKTWDLQGAELRSEVLLSCPDPASYAYKVIWRHYPEEVVCRYSIRGYEGDFGNGLVFRDGWELGNDLRAACSHGAPSGRTLPAAASGVRLDGHGLVTTALKVSADGEAVVLRAFEALGVACQGRLTSMRPIREVREADLRERPAAAADPNAVPFAPFEIKVLRIKLGPAG